MQLNILKDVNPSRRLVEKEPDDEFSPMNLPDAYNPQGVEKIAYEDMHPFLQKLMDEHKEFSAVLDKFEDALLKWRANRWIFTREIDEGLKQFFEYFDHEVTRHNTKEEKKLFPILHDKLVSTGEHNAVDPSMTGISVMEDEHLKVAQLAAIVFNFLTLGSRLPDTDSKEITFQAAFHQGTQIVETMKLHIFREDIVLFPQAMQYFSPEELGTLVE